MGILNYIPGFRSNKPMKKLIATIYYAVCIQYLLIYENKINLIFLVSLPFLVELFKRISEGSGEKIMKLGQLYIFTLAVSLICNLMIGFTVNKINDKNNLENKLENLSREYSLLYEKSQDIINNISSTEKYKNKVKDIESEKSRLSKENEALREEKEVLEKKLER
ncbi:hypothetical protein [Terrisporobacter sp.]|uniref:hypothetical protein n=1 Tax=Terrisporobacter sp. TaxID=1965305 RepID=UPI002637D149|nr:hypothetical protein [Terrisporobacter sp.]